MLCDLTFSLYPSFFFQVDNVKWGSAAEACRCWFSGGYYCLKSPQQWNQQTEADPGPGSPQATDGQLQRTQQTGWGHQHGQL